MNINAYYKQLNQTGAEIQTYSFSDSDTSAAHSISHGYLHDLSIFYELVGNRYEAPLFDLALKEYQLALVALTTGQYRHAFIGLRLFFEMMLAGVLFSACEINYRLWARNEKDIVWAELINEDRGVFCRNFCVSFNEELKDHTKPFKGMSEKVYRECSEYVHGNLHTHIRLPSQIQFTKDVCLEWHDKAATMYLVILFLFSIRYLRSLNTINNAKFTTYKSKIEAIIISELGHIPEIRNQI